MKNLVDYVAMDIKNDFENIKKLLKCNVNDTKNLKKSIKLLRKK